MGSNPVNDLPPGFVLDDLPEGFTLDEPAPENPLKAAGRGMELGLKDLVGTLNPVNLARAVKEIGKAGIELATPPTVSNAGPERARAIIEGAVDIGEKAIGQQGAEEAGRIWTSTIGPALLEPAFGAGLRGGARRALTGMRRRNLERALNARPEDIAFIERNARELNPPIALTDESLARKLKAREELAGMELGQTRSRLGEEQTLSAPGITERIEAAKGKTVREDPAVPGMTRESYRVSRGTRNALDRQKQEVGRAASSEGFVDVDMLDDIRRASDEVANPPVTKLRQEAGVTPAGEVRANQVTADTIRGVMAEAAQSDPVIAQFLGAKHKYSLEAGMKEPITSGIAAGRSRAANQGAMHAFELTGRVAVPGILGGVAFGAPGAIAGTAAGALAFNKLGQFLRSAFWNTLQARTKLRLLEVLDTQGFGAFQDAVSEAAIADAQRRRTAERALQDQGKGVVGP